MTILDAAIAYHRAGLAVWPAIPEQKRPIGEWGGKTPKLLSEDDLVAWRHAMRGLCILCGKVSGGVECIDFDDKGSVYPAWREAVDSAHPGLSDRLVMERSPSGGVHVVYRCPEADRPKTSQLAFAPDDGRLLVETRGDGAVFLCDPSPGYKLFQGSHTAVPIITLAERNTLIALAAAQGVPTKKPVTTRPPVVYVPVASGEMHPYVAKALAEETAEVASCPEGGRNHRLNKAAFNLGHYVGGGVLSEGLARSELTRAALASGLGAHETAMSIESGLAAGIRDPKGVPESPPDDGGVNMDGIAAQARRVAQGPRIEVMEPEEDEDDEADPHVPPSSPIALPDEFYRMPGFVSNVMDFALECAPSPNQILAFCGATALQAHLAGRKIQDDSGMRTNLYLISLANPSSGKDYPRQLNFRILAGIGAMDQGAQSFASGAGLQDSLIDAPAMLYQTDEIASFFMQLAKSKDGAADAMLTELLSIFTSADGVYPIRKKAKTGNNAGPMHIIQPSLTILGSAPVKDFYESLSARVMTNGLFARMVIVEAERPVVLQDKKIAPIPEPILEVARWWNKFVPPDANGNIPLSVVWPEPPIATVAPEAREILTVFRDESAARRNEAAAVNDTVCSSIWGRGAEMSRRFALNYAASQNHLAPIVTPAAADWAVTFVRHQISHSLYMAGLYVAENDVHAAKQRVLRMLHNAPGGELTKSQLTRRTQGMRPRERDEILADLVAGRDVIVGLSKPTGAGRPKEVIRLRRS